MHLFSISIFLVRSRILKEESYNIFLFIFSLSLFKQVLHFSTIFELLICFIIYIFYIEDSINKIIKISSVFMIIIIISSSESSFVISFFLFFSKNCFLHCLTIYFFILSLYLFCCPFLSMIAFRAL